METPEGKLKDKTGNCDKTEDSVVINCTPPQPKTPNCEERKLKNMELLASPVLGGKKRSRKCAKRRLLTTVTTDLDIDQQSSISSNSDKVSSETADSVINELIVDNKPETNQLMKTEHYKSNEVANENKKLEEAAVFDKNSNTSTQEFFINASFSSIDRLCSSVIQEEKASLSSKSESQSSCNELIQEKNKLEDVNNDVLERIAAIKRNQKPLKRLSEISYTIIPKEVFSNSARELELANAKFNHEKKGNIRQPLKSTSFMQFTKLESNSEHNEKPSIKDEKPNLNFCNAVPPEFVDDWNTNSSKISNVIIKDESDIKPVITTNNSGTVKKELLDSNVTLTETDAEFSTASGKGLAVSEDKVLNYKKIYSEIENENLNENTFIGLKRKKSLRLQLNLKENNVINLSSSKNVNKDISPTSNGKLKKAEILKLSEDFSGDSSGIINDGFATAGGKDIKINDEKESYYVSVYNELGDVDENNLSTLKMKRILQLKAAKKPMDKAVIVFNKNKSSSNAKADNDSSIVKSSTEVSNQDMTTDGFSTAGGKIIKVSNEKENYYSSIYNELGDVDENSLSSLKIQKKSLKLSKKPTDKAVLVFNSSNNKPSASLSTTVNRIEMFDTPTTDGFATARGKKIDVSNEKESYYSSVYNELDDIDEYSFNSLKRKKIQPKSFSKPTDKAAIVFNNNKSGSTFGSNSTLTNAEDRINVFDTQNTGDGFSTANGKNIAINPEKEKYYEKIYNRMSQEITDEDSLLHLNKNKLSKLNTKNKTVYKSSSSTNQIRKNVDDVKLTISSDTDDVFYNLDLEKLFQIEPTKTETDDHNCFAVPNESNISRKTNQLASLPKSKFIKEENIIDIGDSSIRTSSPIVKPDRGPVKSHLGMLKRKLESCETKRPERCRSFGGFPVDNQSSPRASKFNKSDAVEEGSINRPLQKGLSVSQCFDSHSDSWLSKVEISYLNNSKMNSPEVKLIRNRSQEEVRDTLACDWKVGNFSDLQGFSFKESTESFRRYLSFENFLRKQQVKYDRCTDLYVHCGQTISISNQTSVKQHLSVQSANNVDMARDTNRSQYVLVEDVPVKSSEHCEIVLEQTSQCGGKRKHVDTDSDTPLTTVKKPRIGLEFQGRRLFSDESDTEEICSKFLEQKNDQQLIPMEIEEPIEVNNEDLIEERCNAILQQEKIIMSKKRIKVKPIVGSLLQKRLENGKNRTSWSDLVGFLVPKARSIPQIKQNHVDLRVIEITALNATDYKFTTSNVVGNRKVATLDVGDGASLIFDENGHAGVDEFQSAFLAMPGVDPKLLPTGWVENHYRWIVWKLASIDRIHFDYKQLPKVLEPKRVTEELKYRYDREIDRAERPALRRILEKDDVPSRRMVLCISSILEMVTGDEADKEARMKLGLQRWKVEATDGWYSIPLTLDSVMTNCILNGKIKEGTKIITYGAELLECERGFYPLEKPTNVSLKIHSNCTRRARWDTKLGFQQNSRPIPLKLRTVLPNGGLVGQVTVVAARVYPLMYREKTANGQSIYRNARSEEKAATAHERACELKVNAMYDEAQKNFDSKKKSDSDEEFELSQMTSNSQTRKHNHMERKQEQFKQKLESRMREDLPPPRQVTPLLKVRLVDDMSTAMLSIWGANEDSSYDIKEGNTITIFNAFASGVRNSEISLTANRFTHIKTETLLKLPYPIRTCTLIPEIMSCLSFEPKFNEFDTVGVVVSWGPAPYGMKNFEVVNLAYPKPSNAGSSFLSILFWDGICSFDYQGLFTLGTVVACSNLEWRRHNAWSVAVAYCSEKSVFTCNPRQPYLSKEIRNLKDLVQNPVAYAESCVDEVQAELSKKLTSRSSQNTPSGSTSERMSFHNNSSLLGAQDSPAGMTVQRRLEKLSQYGSLSDVSPSIVLNNSSTRVKKDYTPVAPRSNA